LIEMYANHKNWEIRESVVFSIISGLKKFPDLIVNLLNKWAESKDENIRRLVAESLRPRTEVKWLRDETKNDNLLKILTILRNDSSIYVRKAVGNNIKDLSKYMPEKMLDLMREWITKANIKVCDELATEIGLSKEEKQLIWTIKHGMRWIKERNPEFHDRLEKILGKNYILYFDEKRNRMAKPLEKKILK
ncbi:MAG: DNA alkylation repair protein, partial [Promethearchaeota archaeon]